MTSVHVLTDHEVAKKTCTHALPHVARVALAHADGAMFVQCMCVRACVCVRACSAGTSLVTPGSAGSSSSRYCTRAPPHCTALSSSSSRGDVRTRSLAQPSRAWCRRCCAGAVRLPANRPILHRVSRKICLRAAHEVPDPCGPWHPLVFVSAGRWCGRCAVDSGGCLPPCADPVRAFTIPLHTMPSSLF